DLALIFFSLGYDSKNNLVVDQCEELCKPGSQPEAAENKRFVGLAYLRGSNITSFVGEDQMQQISNPFVEN
ncbi:MAG: hypothetical protein MHPSP_002348, partial [Paramarteilia canceri]